MINTVNPCENCSTVRDVNEAGYKVFTFRNPYLGNTCVPFLHWACDYNCAKDIEIPGRIVFFCCLKIAQLLFFRCGKVMTDNAYAKFRKTLLI